MGSTTTTSYRVTGLSAANAYSLTVRAKDGLANVSTASSALSVTTAGSVAAGSSHTVMVKSNGTVWAWGDNSYGQVGDGTTTNRSSAVAVSGLTEVAMVEAGSSHSVALKRDGTVWAWGYNSGGQLGDGTTTNRSSPVQVSGLSGVVAVAAGSHHTLALKSDGTVWAWGWNAYGQLGDGTTTDRMNPTQVNGLTGVVAIAAGAYYFSVALKSDGTVWAWGYNGYGQLGDGTTTDRTSPAQVSGLTGGVAIAAGGNYTLALKSDGTVRAWGQNDYGQLGNGSTSDSSTPVTVSSLSGVAAIAAGGKSSLAAKSDGSVVAWGYNGNGQLGDGTTTNRTTAVTVSGLSGATVVAAGRNGSIGHSLAAKSDGSLVAWGYNYYGQLGDGTTTQRTSYVAVTGTVFLDTTAPSAPTSLAASFHTATSFTLSWTAATDNVAVTGYDVYRDGTLVGSTTTTSYRVTGLSAANAYSLTVRAKDGLNNTSTASSALSVTTAGSVAVGYAHTLMVKSNGTVWAWGYNNYGQVGDGTTTNRSSAVTVNGLTEVAMAAAGGSHSVALKRDGTVWAWGYNNYGQLGDGTTTNRSTPVQVSGLSGVIAIAAGLSHSVALKSDGTVWVWGDNQYGQLGNNNGGTQSAPVQIGSLSGIVAVAGGDKHGVALKSDGTVQAWGWNDYGQLGNGSTGAYAASSPVTVGGSLTGVVAIAAGAMHSLALKSDGTVKAWGYNGNGQLGDGSTTDASTPVTVGGSLSGVVAIGAGSIHSVAVKSDGTVKAWGYNGYGQLGDGSTTQRTSPVTVSSLSGGLAVATGSGSLHSLAAKSDGSLVAWGYNYYGQLGDGTTTQRTSYVAVLPDVTAPTAPTTLQAGNVTSTSLTLTWNPSTDNVAVTGYEVFSNGISMGTTTGLSMDLSGLSSSLGRIGLAVRARDAVGNWSGPAGLIVTYADTTAPTTPAFFNYAELTAKTVTLVWSASLDNVGVTSYEVFRGGVSQGTTTGLAFRDTGLTASTSYTYTLKASDAAANQSSAATLNVTTTADYLTDTDGDRIPDVTETALGTNVNSSATADTTNQTQQSIHRPLPQ